MCAEKCVMKVYFEKLNEISFIVLQIRDILTNQPNVKKPCLTLAHKCNISSCVLLSTIFKKLCTRMLEMIVVQMQLGILRAH